MILTLIGCSWITSGGLFLWKPHWLKKRLRKKGLKYVRRLMGTTYLFAVGSMFGLAYDIGLFSAYIGALILSSAVFFYLVKLYRRMKTHATETFDQVEDRMISRVAIAYVIAGVILIIGSNRQMFM